jgi:hypothetical protein
LKIIRTPTKQFTVRRRIILAFYFNSSRFAKIFGALLGRIQEIGQMIILRGMICNILSTSGRVCSDKLFHSLVNTNNALINDLINRPPDTTPQSEEEKE